LRRLFELLVTQIFIREKMLWARPRALPTTPQAVPSDFSST
jgi:hypothetical protein